MSFTQHGLFGESKEVASASSDYADAVTKDAALAAALVALKTGRRPLDEPVRTQGGDMTTIAECEFYNAPTLQKSGLIMEAQERHRVQVEIDAGRDPFADDYHIPGHEAYDAIFESIRLGENPDELEFTAWSHYFPDHARKIKLSECTFTGLEHLTYAQLKSEVLDDIDRHAAHIAPESD